MIPFIDLPYAPDALAPVISAETLAFHHGKHLRAYVNNLNAAIVGTPADNLSLEEIVVSSEGGVFNNAGQVFNHNLYFSQFRSPSEGNAPSGALAEVIDKAFGSFEAFCKEFETKGASLFGSGWVYLSADKDGGLHITQHSNAGNPLKEGLRPLLTFDVWEHAYYLDYQNRRADQLHALWAIVDWSVVEARLG